MAWTHQYHFTTMQQWYGTSVSKLTLQSGPRSYNDATTAYTAGYTGNDSRCHAIRCLFSQLESLDKNCVTSITIYYRRVHISDKCPLEYSVTLRHGILKSSPTTYLDCNGSGTMFPYKNNNADWKGTNSEDYASVTKNGYQYRTLSLSDYDNLKTYGWVLAMYYNGVYRAIGIDDVYLEVKTTQNQYTLSYNVNGGAGSIDSKSQLGIGSTEIAITSSIPTRQGYTFQGWAESATATTASYKKGDTITISADKTLYAVWAEAGQNIELHYQDENNTIINIGGSINEPYGENLPMNLVRLNYKFIGWSLYPWQYFPINQQTINWQLTSHSLYAWWEPDPPFKRVIIYQI